MNLSQVLNGLGYVFGSAFVAAGLIEVPQLGPYSKALTAFGASLLAVSQWSKLKVDTKLTVLLPLIALLGFSACKTLPTPVEVKDCAAEAAKAEFYDLFPKVRTILATGANPAVIATELEKMVAQFGINMITCLVQHIGGEAAGALASYPDDPINQRVKANAEVWLREHGAHS